MLYNGHFLDRSHKMPVPVTDTFSAYRGCSLQRPICQSDGNPPHPMIHSDLAEDAHWRFAAHEQAAAVLRILSYQNPSCQAEMVSAGTIKHLVKLCDVFNPEGSHGNCCQSVYQCSTEATHLLHELTFQKKLVGKVREMPLDVLREKAVVLIKTGEQIISDSTVETDCA